MLLGTCQRVAEDSRGLVIDEGEVAVGLVLDDFLHYSDEVYCYEEFTPGGVSYGLGVWCGWDGGGPEGRASGGWGFFFLYGNPKIGESAGFIQ